MTWIDRLMPPDSTRASVYFRWTVVVLSLVVLAFAIWIGEDLLDRISKPLCPAGLWHAGLGWAHCSYPPISIFKYGAMYASYAVLALLVIQRAAPAGKPLASWLLLVGLMVPPAYHLLLVQFSWVETGKLLLVLAVALLYRIGTRPAARA